MIQNLKALTFIVIAMTSTSIYANTKKPLTWQIKNTSWNKSTEKSYEEFVAAIGKAKRAGICHTTGQCIKSPIANPKYYNLNPSNLSDVYSDCADLPYILKAYFSWMNDLPFAYPVHLTQSSAKGPESESLLAQLRQLETEYANAGFFKRGGIKKRIKAIREQLYGSSGADIRYNRFGNVIMDKKYVKNGDNINTVLNNVADAISTATFRTNASNNTTDRLFRDTYPVKVSRGSIKAGTVLYDPNGHIAVVYEVTANGKIHLIDAHPDNSLTAITYGEKFTQTNVEIGGGFSNWRPFEMGDRVLAAANETLPDYSLEQFERKKAFLVEGQTMSFHEYVRNMLSVGSLKYNPVNELQELMEELCHDVSERVTSVSAAVSAGISRQNHPSELPANIYGTDGDWENFSTPSRDARLKASVREGRALMQKLIVDQRNGSANVEYAGSDLVDDLKKTYTEAANKCVFNITKTNNQVQTITLDHVLKNIYKLSFDPYHCAELRWGLLDAESLKSCSSSRENMEWYNAEQGMRNLIDRDYSVKMNYSLRDLPSSKFGAVSEENISIEDILSY